MRMKLCTFNDQCDLHHHLYTHCKAMYIGETGCRLTHQFGKHLCSVEGWSSTSTVPKWVLLHCLTFQCSGPQFHQSRLCLCMAKQLKGTIAERQREEMRLIFCHKTLAPHGINTDFKFQIFKLQNYSMGLNYLFLVSQICACLHTCMHLFVYFVVYF